MTLEIVGRRIIDALDHAGIPHMLTGSFAAAYHGIPRATQDIDLVITPSVDQLRVFVRRLSPAEFYVDESAALDALRLEGQFNIIDMQSGWKIDLICRRSRAFSRTEFDRRVPAAAWGVSISIATIEDLILAKLEWAKVGGSERQIEDVAALLERRFADLDRSYLDPWLRELGVESEWRRAVERAGLKS